MALYTYEGVNLNLSLKVYNCTEYGVTPDNANNTTALQNLIDTVGNAGGGIIWVPIGTYTFDTTFTSSRDYVVQMMDHVSVIGESLTKSVFKIVGNSAKGATMYKSKENAGPNNPLVGCRFENMTYDATDSSATTYSAKGKIFYFQYVRDCIWRDLRLIGTVATALGIDMIDNVVIDSIYCYNCARQWSSGKAGGAGIGIGTGSGEWGDENFVIRNCICDSCGHYGIFIEDQGMFESPQVAYNPQGQIIANNIVRNGRNYGIGVRGGRLVTIVGNNVYNNANGGIYLDYGANHVSVLNNMISNEVSAVCFGNESTFAACSEVVIANNVFSDCTNGIVEVLTPSNCIYENNITI